jgi:hypothetical protein
LNNNAEKLSAANANRRKEGREGKQKEKMIKTVKERKTERKRNIGRKYKRERQRDVERP